MLNIEIRKADQMPGIYSCYLTFSQFNKSWIEVIRQFNTRKYDAYSKTWEFPLYCLSEIVSRYPNLPIHIHWKKEKSDDKTLKIPKLDLKRELFVHQQVAVEYGIQKRKYILGDTMGVGKTSSVIGEALALKKMGLVKQCLIICCVSDLQYNWVNEIKTVCDESCFVLGTRYRKKKLDANGLPQAYAGTVKDRIEDLKTHKEFFIITNNKTLENEEFVDILRGKSKFKTDITFLAIDEFHKNTGNPNSIAGKNLQKLAGMEYIVPMTGTLLRNKPTDAWAALHLIGMENSSFSVFKAFYCIRGEFNNTVGYKNLEHLQYQLSQCQLRRTKEEVLPYLPEKIFTNVYVTMNERQKMIYDEAYNWALENIDLIAENANPLGQLIRLRQATGYTGILSSTIKESAKIDRICDDVDEILESGDKILIYSNWTEITDEIYNRLSVKYPVLRITGKDVKNGAEVEEIKAKFQNDPKYRIILGTTSKMGTGHTLTAGTWVLFADEPWTYADKMQAIDRTHRPGQKNNVNIRTYITKDTIDEKVNEIIEQKKEMSDFIVDKIPPKERMSLTKFLLDLE